MRKSTKDTGITLIALVVTIVVLLILAGIIIRLVFSDNGIINKARESEEAEKQSRIAEMVNLEVLGSYGTEGKIELGVLNNNLEKNIEGITHDGETLTNNPITSLPSTVEVDGVEVVINGDYIRGEEPVDLTKLAIGDYVDYTYDSAANYELSKNQSGYTNDQVIAQESGLRWRILNIDTSTGKIDLTTEKATDATVDFRGCLGYNNGVYLLHDICAKLYSNRSLGVTARSISLDDLDKHLTEAGKRQRDSYKTNAVQYGDVVTYTTNPRYPSLYAKENTSGINLDVTGLSEDGIKERLKADGIDRSDKYYETPTTEVFGPTPGNNGMTIYSNYYEIGFNTTTYGEAFSVLKQASSKYYWLATRYTNNNTGGYAYFGIFFADPTIGGSYLVNSAGGQDGYHYCLRPVVTIDANLIDMGAGKDENGTWSLK